jgi:hypothetical protein
MLEREEENQESKLERQGSKRIESEVDGREQAGEA